MVGGVVGVVVQSTSAIAVVVAGVVGIVVVGAFSLIVIIGSVSIVVAVALLLFDYCCCWCRRCC